MEPKPIRKNMKFGKLPIGAIFHDGKLLCVKIDAEHCDWYDRCGACGKLNVPIREMPVEADKLVQAECV